MPPLRRPLPSAAAQGRVPPQVQQRKGESLRKYIQRFCQCRNTIAKISGESVCIAFRRGVRDRKIAEKLATRVISSPTELFALADKCARVAEARERQSGRPNAKEAKAPDPPVGPSFGNTAKWCSITSLGTPGMSDGCHANTSTFARRKVMSASSYLGSRDPPTFTVLAGSASSGTSLIEPASLAAIRILAWANSRSS